VHELSVTQNLLELTLRHAAQAGAARVTELHLVIGELSSFVDESVQFYWDIVAKGTPAEGAALRFRRVAAALRCEDCAHEFPLDRREFVCPACGGQRIRVVGGDEFFLESIDVDLAPGAPAAAE